MIRTKKDSHCFSGLRPSSFLFCSAENPYPSLNKEYGANDGILPSHFRIIIENAAFQLQAYV